MYNVPGKVPHTMALFTESSSKVLTTELAWHKLYDEIISSFSLEGLPCPVRKHVLDAFTAWRIEEWHLLNMFVKGQVKASRQSFMSA